MQEEEEKEKKENLGLENGVGAASGTRVLKQFLVTSISS